MKEYAIFDLDGTLIDSFECICRNINKTLQSFDCPVCTKSQFEEYRHKDLRELFSFAVKTTNGKVSMSLFKCIFDKMHLDDCIDGVTVIEKTKSLLGNAKQKGLGIIVLTNKKQEIAEKICHALSLDVFDIIVIGRKTVNAIKNSQIIKKIFHELQIETKNCVVYIGDSKADSSLSKYLNINYKDINLI